MATDSSLVVYTYVPLTYIDVTAGMNLQAILVNINTAINDMNPAPDYTGYNLGPYNGYSITQTDGTSHPTDTENFAEGIAKIVCNFEYAFYTFRDTDYVADQLIITNAIDTLATPGLTYSASGGGVSIAITSGMTLNQVLTATYTSVGGILSKLAAPGTQWADISVTQPTSLNAAFDALIGYSLSAIGLLTSDKQDLIPTFDNSSNCLAGTGTDNISQTIDLLIAYVCAIDNSFVAGDITSTCVSSENNLQDWIQSIVNYIESYESNNITSVSTGLVLTSNSACNGKNIAIDSTWSGLSKVAVSSVDTTPAVLISKLTAGTGITLTKLNPGGNETVSIAVTNPNTDKVKVNSSDTVAGYLVDKITSAGTGGGWGLNIGVAASTDNSRVVLNPTVSNPAVFVQNLLNYISTDPSLLATFCGLIAQCDGNVCIGPTSLTVSISTLDFILDWTVAVSSVSQTVKYRLRGDVSWISNVNISDPNPLANSTNSATVSNLCVNCVYQFQVDNNCANGVNGSNVYESIIYNCQTLSSSVTANVVTVTQDPLTTVELIEYILYEDTTPLETVNATGSNPIATFAAVTPNPAATYTVQWRYGTTVNGTMLYSTDASQLNGYCVSGTIVI
jgi:hypothetical protein